MLVGDIEVVKSILSESPPIDIVSVPFVIVVVVKDITKFLPDSTVYPVWVKSPLAPVVCVATPLPIDQFVPVVQPVAVAKVPFVHLSVPSVSVVCFISNSSTFISNFSVDCLYLI